MGMKAYPIFIFRYKRVTSRPRSRSGAPTLSHPFLQKKNITKQYSFLQGTRLQEATNRKRPHSIYIIIYRNFAFNR